AKERLAMPGDFYTKKIRAKKEGRPRRYGDCGSRGGNNGGTWKLSEAGPYFTTLILIVFVRCFSRMGILARTTKISPDTTCPSFLRISSTSAMVSSVELVLS